MTDQPQSNPRLLPVLIAGFALLILLLGGAAYVAISAIETVESDAERIISQEQATMRLIDEVQGEEGNLSAVFYSIAAGRSVNDKRQLSVRLDDLEMAIRNTTSAGLAAGGSPLWNEVQLAADAFIAEGRQTLASGRAATNAFYEHHQNLNDAVAELANANFITEAARERAERQRSAERVRSSIILLGIAIVVALVGALLTMRSVQTMFDRLQWQTSELTQLSKRTMADQEKTARRFSHEMHDHFGQTLSALEANVVAMQHSGVYKPERIEDCLALIKDSVDQVRAMSQLLRPSILDDFGLSASLKWLADSFSERTGVPVEYASSFDERLPEDGEAHLFRITQEALTNISKHSDATRVQIGLSAPRDRVLLRISDNGKGMVLGEKSDTVRVVRGLGLVGMRARARAAGGTLFVESQPGAGTTIVVDVPRETAEHDPNNSNLVS